MTAAALKTPVLRNAAGEPPLGVGGLAFRDDQGEIIQHDNPRYRSGLTQTGVLELEGGEWLAYPFRCDGELFATREAALSAAVDALVSKALKYRDNKDGEGTKWTEGYANAVIDWAMALKPAQVAETSDVLANPDRQISDPVVRELAEAHGKRRQFPAKHIFAMTTAVEDGRIISVATCACKTAFKFASNDPLRMDAAIEAHLRRFDYEPMVDGRGIPIKPGDPARISGSKQKVKGKPIKEGIERGKTSATTAAHDPDILAALRAIDAGQEIPGEMARHLVGEGLAHATTKRMVLTDAGRALLESSPDVADAAVPPLPRTEPAPDDAPIHPTGAGSPVPTGVEMDDYLERVAAKDAPIGAGLPPTDDPTLWEWKALAAIEARVSISGPLVQDLIKRGLVVVDIDDELVLMDDGLERLVELEARFNPAAAAEKEPWIEGEPKECDSSAWDRLPPVVRADDDDDLAIDWPSYDAFIEDKIVTAPLRGIEVARDALHPYLKPHCKDLTVWALRLGCAAIFASFGLHKTAMQLEWCRQLVNYSGSPSLCVVPLGVRHGFIKEALNLGMDVRFIRTEAEFDELYCEGVRYFITNYESIREGKLDPNAFGAVSLDEASVLRSYGSKTFQEFLPLFAKVPFKLVATATPSPNRYKELIHYSGFLGIMDTGLALTRFFQRNSEKAGDLTLYPHKEAEFWMWMHSWAAFLQKPSELGYSDEGYELPPLKINWHEVPADHGKAEPERDGQGVMFRAVATDLQSAAKARRDSLPARIARMMEIIAQDPEPHRIIWHDLEAEREAIEQALPEVVTITGSMDIDAREERLHDFEEGRIKYFGTKPILSGSGSNFQYHCHKAIYVALTGFGYKFNDFIQSLYRLQRFGQKHPVEIDIIYSEDERAGRATLEEKWALDATMRARMSEIIKAHGLNVLPLRDALLRSIGVKRVEVKGTNFRAINNDCVAEARAWPDNCLDQIITSIPFSNHYEYSASYRDFGHTDDNGHFWSQMDFLTAELVRMLRPGRLACIHVKDRVLFGAVTGEGVPTISPFHAEAIMHYRAHGLQYMGMITVVTDVVRENNQTYRLGWSENAKDGTKMGVGSPEYVLLFRKRQSDRTRSYADVPVEKSKEEYTRARWQIDAHAFWRSSGNRHLTPEEFAALGPGDLAKLFASTSAERIYNFEAHVAIGEALERLGTLPATFMSIAPGSHDAGVWHDVNRMRTLNMMQQRKGAEMHLCPLQFDIVDRLIERYSNPGELIFDPFGGLMTVPYRALLKGRKGAATELSATYFLDGVKYLQAAEEKLATPVLFDLAAFDAANTPPPPRDRLDGGGE